MRAYSLAPPGDPTDGPARAEIALEGALETARDTTPVLVTDALQELGWFDRFTDLFLGGIAALASADAVDDLRTRGLQHLHEHLAPDAVARLIADLDVRLRRFAFPLAIDIVAATAPDLGHRYFIGQRVFVRAQVPYPMLAEYPDLVTAGHLAGHLRPTGRHRDVDLTHPVGSVSLWAALAPVQAGNSIEIVVDHDRAPIVPTFAPGDLCLFQSDSVHASVENHTNETRVSVGVRVLASTHLRYGPGNHWRPYADARLLGTPFASLATVRSRCTTAALRRWRFRRRWERQQRAAGRPDTPSLKR